MKNNLIDNIDCNDNQNISQEHHNVVDINCEKEINNPKQESKEDNSENKESENKESENKESENIESENKESENNEEIFGSRKLEKNLNIKENKKEKKFKNVIIIPYRNRKSHLEYFIENLNIIIKKYLPETLILVVEQLGDKLFNRGLLLNIGFKEYLNETEFFFTHDVDIIPSEKIVKEIYTSEKHDIFRIKSAHIESLGGVIKVKNDVIIKINGFPNNIWGWGIEDRALYFRCKIMSVKINSSKIEDFTFLKHKSNRTHLFSGEKKKISDSWRNNYIKTLSNSERTDHVMNNGINNLDYKISERYFLNKNIKNIKVNI